MRLKLVLVAAVLVLTGCARQAAAPEPDDGPRIYPIAREMDDAGS